MRKLVQASVQASGSRSAVMVGSVVKYAIWIFAFIIVLSELGIAAAFMQILFTGLVAALSIALGLAFGLGGKEAASRAVDKFSNNMKM
jgi:small-conductance mechanosensitive channel